MQKAQGRRCRSDIIHDRSLGKLQVEVPRCDTCLVEYRSDLHQQVFLGKLYCGEIDGDAEVGIPAPLPGTELATGGTQDPLADGNYQAGVLRNLEELRRRNHAHFRVAPAQQRFHADDPSGFHIDLGLVMQFELILLDSLSKLVLKREIPV